MKIKRLQLISIILILFSNIFLYSEKYAILKHNLAPISEKFSTRYNYDVYELNSMINKLSDSVYDEKKTPVYNLLLRNALDIFNGYSNYKSSTGYVNFLSDKGMGLLNNLKTLHKNISINKLSWKKSYPDFIQLIQHIPSASNDHSSWNLDMFVDVFPGMTDEQVLALKNERNNAYTVQLSKRCSKQCLHCAAIAKGRKLSQIDHMPLPIILKLLKKMRDLEKDKYLKVHLYDHSDISDYKDPVLKSDILPVLDFCRSKGIDSSSFTHGAAESKNLFNNYLPETISLHPFHADILSFIKKLISSKNPEHLIGEKNKLIRKYVNIFLETSSFVDPKKRNDLPYKIAVNSNDHYHLVKVRRYFINKAEKMAIKKDKNGNKALKIIEHLISFQDEIYAEYIDKIKKINKSAHVQDEDISLIFAGRAAKLLRSLGITEKTIKLINSFNDDFLYGELIYVIESDGRISPLAPEIYFEDTFTIPYKTVAEIFKSADSDGFRKFTTLLQLILESQTSKQFISHEDLSFFAGKKLNKNHKIELRSQFDLEFDSANYLKFLKSFITGNKMIRHLLLDLNDVNKSMLFDFLTSMPVPLKLNLLKKKLFYVPVKNINLNYSEIKDDLFYPRRSFNFPILGHVFNIKKTFHHTELGHIEFTKSA